MSKTSRKANANNFTFEHLLDLEIARFRTEAFKHKRQWRVGQTIAIILLTGSSIFSTAAASFKEYSVWLALLAAVCSATTIAVTSWLEMHKSFDLWKFETNIQHNLRDVKRKMEFEKISRKWNAASEQEAMTAVEKIIKASKVDWKQIQLKS